MEMYLTGTEILSQMRAMMGQQQSEGVSGISSNQHKAFRDRAHMKALADSTWLSSEVRVTVNVGAEQYKVAYPTDMAVGSVRELAICDPLDGSGGIYSPISMRDLPAWIDFDQIEALGGKEFDAIQGTPSYGQQRRDFIYLYPPNDSTPRKLRVRGNVRKTFATEGQTSTCDGELVIYWAVALAYGAAGDQGQQAFYQQLYQDRVGSLRAAQCTGEVVTFRPDAPTLDGLSIFRPVPNWDTSPYVPNV